VKNSQVAECWGRNQPANAGNLSTDGDDLYSYNLLIGYTTPKGTKVALDYTARGKMVSQTTSCHVGLAARNADELMHPVTHEVMTN
jgi:YD repeat-containing protein